jgi:hypothetical protein
MTTDTKTTETEQLVNRLWDGERINNRVRFLQRKQDQIRRFIKTCTQEDFLCRVTEKHIIAAAVEKFNLALGSKEESTKLVIIFLETRQWAESSLEKEASRISQLTIADFKNADPEIAAAAETRFRKELASCGFQRGVK